jgi:hypothetical protein
LVQLKSDGVGFRVIAPEELPKLFTRKAEESGLFTPINGSESSSSEMDQKPPEDPLLEFLERRKNLRNLFDGRYSHRAIAIRNYHRHIQFMELGHKSGAGLMLDEQC